MRMNWDTYFIKMARLASEKSKDRSTKCGAVIVGPDMEVRSTGYNGFIRGADDNIDADHERPRKYLLTEHGERNAIYNAARAGISTARCKMYLNWSVRCCSDCTRSIVQSGIVEVIGDINNPFPGKGDLWKTNWEASEYMLNQAGVLIRNVSVD
jgi:dCMP deaminase